MDCGYRFRDLILHHGFICHRGGCGVLKRDRNLDLFVPGSRVMCPLGPKHTWLEAVVKIGRSYIVMNC